MFCFLTRLSGLCFKTVFLFSVVSVSCTAFQRFNSLKLVYLHSIMLERDDIYDHVREFRRRYEKVHAQ